MHVTARSLSTAVGPCSTTVSILAYGAELKPHGNRIDSQICGFRRPVPPHKLWESQFRLCRHVTHTDIEQAVTHNSVTLTLKHSPIDTLASQWFLVGWLTMPLMPFSCLPSLPVLRGPVDLRKWPTLLPYITNTNDSKAGYLPYKWSEHPIPGWEISWSRGIGVWYHPSRHCEQPVLHEKNLQIIIS